MLSTNLHRSLILVAVGGASVAALVLADASGSTPTRWTAGGVVFLVGAAALLAASVWWPRVGIGLSMLLTAVAALSVGVVLVTVIDAWRGRGAIIWNNPALAVVAGIIPPLAIAAGIATVRKAFRGLLRPSAATALTMLFALVAGVSGLMVLASYSTLTPLLPGEPIP